MVFKCGIMVFCMKSKLAFAQEQPFKLVKKGGVRRSSALPPTVGAEGAELGGKCSRPF